MTAPAPILQRRAYQQEVLRASVDKRFFAMLWRRQGGKSTTLSELAVAAMMAVPGLTVTYASASLLLGREIVYKEAQLMSGVFRRLGNRLEACDAKGGKLLAAPGGNLDQDLLAELFESQRLEFRVRHDHTTVSRTQVIAPNPATARGWTGWVILDEFGFIRDFRDLWEAVEPIVSTNWSFHLIMATTPPRDDSHYSYELTAPPTGMTWTANPAGNWYESEGRVPVHRVSIYDAHLAGVKLYDLRTGRELTPEEHRAAADDKDAWRRNYNIEHVLGGTSACGFLVLDSAQRRGIGRCACFMIESDEDFERALAWLEVRLGPGPVGIGIDLATTEHATSNPTSVSVGERLGIETPFPAIFVWKTSDPAVQKYRFRRIVQTVRRRPSAAPARRVCIDATNERLFAAEVRTELAALVPVVLVIGSDGITPPGHESMTMKQYLGSRLVSELEDNHLWLPPERYIREDFRLVRKERGLFVCTPDSQGRHGDTFDSSKLALHALDAPAAASPILFTDSPRSRVLADLGDLV